MADDPKSFMKKTDEELTFDALSAMPGSAVYGWARTEMERRNSLRMLEITKQQLEITKQELEITKQSLKASEESVAATQQMVRANESLSESTKFLAAYTKSLTVATWAIVLITLLSQVTIIILSIKK